MKLTNRWYSKLVASYCIKFDKNHDKHLDQVGKDKGYPAY